MKGQSKEKKQANSNVASDVLKTESDERKRQKKPAGVIYCGHDGWRNFITSFRDDRYSHARWGLTDRDCLARLFFGSKIKSRDLGRR